MSEPTSAGQAAGASAHPQRMLMVETRSDWESNDVPDFLRLARGVLQTGMALDLFLVQNSVLLLRSGLRDDLAALAANASCRIWADRYALKLRGLTADDVAGCAAIAGTDELVRLMTVPHTRLVWHS
ncbi:MAG: hypothetical protein ACLGI6_17325 [Gammaproteobacteria bacterium]